MAKKPFMNMKPQDLKALGAGLELSMVIGGMAYGGYWLDQKFATEPWLLLTCLMRGIFGGSWHTIKIVNGGKLPDMGFDKMFKKQQDKKNETPDEDK